MGVFLKYTMILELGEMPVLIVCLKWLKKIWKFRKKNLT